MASDQTFCYRPVVIIHYNLDLWLCIVLTKCMEYVHCEGQQEKGERLIITKVWRTRDKYKSGDTRATNTII